MVEELDKIFLQEILMVTILTAKYKDEMMEQTRGEQGSTPVCWTQEC